MSVMTIEARKIPLDQMNAPGNDEIEEALNALAAITDPTLSEKDKDLAKHILNRFRRNFPGFESCLT